MREVPGQVTMSGWWTLKETASRAIVGAARNDEN
jgi:hypothetical protein